MKKYILSAAATLALTAHVCAQKPLNALDYRLQSWPEAEQFKSARGAEHLFVSGSLGSIFSFAQGAGYNPFQSEKTGLSASAYVGKWFTPRHGLRVGLHTAYLPHPTDAKMKMGGLSADYLMNLSVVAAGYNPQRLFEVYGVAGLAADLAYQQNWDDRRLNPSAYLGLQGRVRLSPITDLFVEPRLQLANDGYDGQAHWRGYDAAFTLQAGLTYHVLERSERASTASFERSPFGNNTFISFATGINGLLTRGYDAAPGPELSLAVGKWLAPHSGLRLGAVGGLSYLNRPNDERHRHKFVEARLDYLLNLNNACGYYRENPFEMNVVAGVSLGAGSSYLQRGLQPTVGASAGLMGNLWVSEHTSLFVEPRVTLYPGDFASGVSLHGYDLLGEVAVGFTMHTANRSEREAMGKPDTSDFWNQVFVQVGAGLEMIATPATLIQGNMMGPNGYLAVGKWWNAASGLRLAVDAGWVKDRNASQYRRMFNGTFSADYLWNLSNGLYGYDPDRTFSLTASAGAVLTARAGNGTAKSLEPGVEAGLMGLWQVNQRTGLFLEPVLRVYGKDLNPAYSVRNRFTVMPHLRAGVLLNMQPYDRNAYHSLFDSNDRRSFVSVSAGANTIVSRNMLKNQPGLSLAASLGQWYTPLSGWRANLLVQRGKNSSDLHYQYAALEADYLFNLSTLYGGYDPERVFSLHALAGASAGASYIAGDLGFVGGAHAGLQADFRLTPGLHLYIEPRAALYSRNYGYRYQTFVPGAELSAGITHYFRQAGPSGGTGERNSFVLLGTGLGLYSGASGSTPVGQLLTKSFDVTYGHWFNGLHGLQLGVSNTHLNVQKDTPLNFVGLKAGYLLSLSNLLAGTDDSRRLSLDGLAGVLVALPTGNDVSKTAAGAEAGLRGTYRFGKGTGLYVQPVMRIYDSQLNRIRKTSAGIDAAGALEFGLSHRF